MVDERLSVNDVLRKYSRKIEGQIKTSGTQKVNYSREYSEFKAEMAPELNRYEKWCKGVGSKIRLKVAKKDEDKVRHAIEVAHLDIEPWQAVSLGVMSFLGTFLLGIILSVAIMLISGEGFAGFPFLLFFLIIIVALFLFYYVNGIPVRMANKWRLKASSQMVPALLYIVVYMRHTPNLEKAVAFASEHLQYPLALDFKKIFYNVQTGKFSTMKESLDNYLESWRDYSPAFIEGFHLIESSLFEPDNARRIATLEKALQVVLDGVYDQMLKFVHNVKAPVQNTYMLGTTLPVLGIALLPLASAMVGGMLKVSHVFILYNLLIPFAAFFLMNKYLMLRPGGHGETSLLEKNPLYPKYKSNSHYWKALAICLPLIFIGLIPLLYQSVFLVDTLHLNPGVKFTDFGISFFGDDYLIDYKVATSGGSTITSLSELQDAKAGSGVAGPFGIFALFLGLFIPLGVALFFAIAYKSKTKDLILEREKTKQLEAEFNNSLFQLGNRMGNGIPPEVVFGKVAESARGLMTEDFFKRVNYNIQQMGMSVEKAIFDSNRGVIKYYPSELIATSMKVLVESSKKGLKIAAVSLMSISEYVKNIQKISSRLRDVLAEVISDMKSNMTFLAPLLSGVVVGLAGMIVGILNKLNIPELEASGADVGSLSGLLGIFEITNMIPPYYLQIAIGIYLVQVVFILTGALVMINSGEDKLEESYEIGKNLNTGILMYFVVAFISSLLLFVLASIVLSGL